jgi:hypothetical protein
MPQKGLSMRKIREVLHNKDSVAGTAQRDTWIGTRKLRGAIRSTIAALSGLTVFIVSRGKARRRNRVHALPWLIASVCP